VFSYCYNNITKAKGMKMELQKNIEGNIELD